MRLTASVPQLRAKIFLKDQESRSAPALFRHGTDNERRVIRTSPEHSVEDLPMTMVVTEPCFGCKYTDCVVVCPVDCFYEGESMLFIHPDQCIDCGACVPECPTNAIFYEGDVPAPWAGYIELNREMSKTCPNIREKRVSLRSDVTN